MVNAPIAVDLLKHAIKMKRLLFFFWLLGIGLKSNAQKNYFIYLQTDNKQNFYVKLNGKILSSSSSGYLLISKLQTGNYNFVVGFPKNEWKQQNFSVDVNEADAGYALKNFGDEGWGLYNFQNMKVVMNDKIKEGKNLEKMLAAKVPNTAVIETPEKITEIKETPKVVQVIEEKYAPINTTSVAENSTKVVAQISNTSIKKIDTQRQKEGLQIRYKIDDGTTNEIVSILIENTTIETPKTDLTEKANSSKEKFLDIELQNPNAPISVNEKPKNEVEKIVVPSPTQNIFSNDCKEQANADDFATIRKKILAADSEPAMVAAADKYFKLKCYSVEQIKSLTALFLSNKGRYTFLDAAYLYTTDAENFASLEALLTDEYYVKRFKAMLRN
jgi:hypothetical protein